MLLQAWTVSDRNVGIGCSWEALLSQAPVTADDNTSSSPIQRSRQKCKSSPIRGLRLKHPAFEEDRKILGLSGFICEPTGSLRGFKLINQSKDIELNLYLWSGDFEMCFKWKGSKGPAPLLPHSPRLPALVGELAVSSITGPL